MQQYSQIIFLVVIVVAFYFLLIRPQQQQAKRQKEMVAALAPGTHIITIGGIYATVVSVDEDRVRVAVADGSELEIAKRAVATILPDGHGAADSDESVDDSDEPPLAGGTDAADADAQEGDSADA
ncbi:MAG TPA: preprotein translocase subunit YajC [Coriobacteriia bacterium]